MQMTLVASIMILVSLLPIQQKRPATGEQRKTPVELWWVGDDVFSKGMCQAFFAAFESSPDFNLQERNKLGNLIVTIPQNVGWKEVGKRTRVTYVVEFSTSDERVFMTRKGWCWHEEYAKCASLILKEAKVAARKLPR